MGDSPESQKLEMPRMNIKTDWKLPDPPEGFTQACAFHHEDGAVVLDWTRAERDFASEQDIDSGIEWPFTKIEPMPDDCWLEVNILPIRA